jgi:hypothetical protein
MSRRAGPPQAGERPLGVQALQAPWGPDET